MTAVPGDLLNQNYWISKELVAEIEKDGEEYRIYFKTNRVSENSEGLKMYKPASIYKIIKEG